MEGIGWLPASAIDQGGLLLRLCIIGPPKVGKTTVAIATAPGPVGVLLCDDESALREARRSCVEKPDHYKVISLRGTKYQDLLDKIAFVKREAKRGYISTIVVDPLPEISTCIEAEAIFATRTHRGADDGRKAYPLYTRRILQTIRLLLEIRCHVIVITHPELPKAKSDDEEKALPDDGLQIPNLATREARVRAAGMFSDIVYMGFDPDDEKRYFLTGPRGAITNARCRSLRSTQELKPSIKGLIRRFTAGLERSAPVPALTPVAAETPAKAPKLAKAPPAE